MTEHNYELLLKGKDDKYRASIDVFDTLNYELLFNEVGSYDIKIPHEKSHYEEIEQFGAVEIVRDSIVVYTGLIQNINRRWNENENSITLSGGDSNYWLATRLALPVPLGAGNYSTAEHDVRTGACETIMKQYVDYNMGINSHSLRKITGVTVDPDMGSGIYLTGRARFQNLLTFLQELAIQGGDIGFEMNARLFTVYLPSDKTSYIIFSKEFGNLEEFEYNYKSPMFNYVICGGGGEGTARVFSEHGDSQSILDYLRIESFRDRRDTSDSAEMYATIEEELTNNKEQFSLSFIPSETTNIRFYDDYFLGDKIRCVVDGANYDAVIRSASFNVDRNNGESLKIGIGTPAFSGGALTMTMLNNVLQRRLRNLERR